MNEQITTFSKFHISIGLIFSARQRA